MSNRPAYVQEAIAQIKRELSATAEVARMCGATNAQIIATLRAERVKILAHENTMPSTWRGENWRPEAIAEWVAHQAA